MDNKLPAWAMSVTGPGFVGSGALAGERPPHFGKRVARLGAGCHGVWCDLVAAGDLAGGGCLANTPLKLTWLNLGASRRHYAH